MSSNSQVIIKSKKTVYIGLLAGVIVIAIPYILKWNDVARYMTSIFVPVIFIYLFSTYCRTIVFDKTGCMVQLLWIKKHYSWEQLTFSLTKKDHPYLIFDDLRTFKLYGMEFSTEPIIRPEYNSMENYACGHPFSYVFIYFYSNEIEKKRIILYPCNMDEFIMKLMDWGIIPKQDVSTYIHRFDVEHNLPKLNLKMPK